MSNVELIKKFYVAFKNQDKDAIFALCDDKIKWQLTEGMPNGGHTLEKKTCLKGISQRCYQILKNFMQYQNNSQT